MHEVAREQNLQGSSGNGKNMKKYCSGEKEKHHFEMTIRCVEKTFKLLAQKVTPNLHQEVTANLLQKCRQDGAKMSAKFRQKDGVRNRDFVEFDHFSIA